MTVTEPIRRSEIPAGMMLAGRYSLRERLATGGMATVYRALDESSGRLVALKHYDGKLATKPEGMSLFEREYRTLAALRHPRIIEVYDYGLYEERPFYTMELLDGEDLRRLSPLSYPQACAYMRDVASSLALLHARGFVHRDVSPVNVRVTADGRAKLIDFGALASFGRHSEVIGTPQCIAPEVLQGLPLDARSDLFSLGAVFYFLLTARHAFPARTLAQAPLVWQIPPTKPSDAFRRLGADSLPIPAELDELVLSLLSLDSAGRPASAGLVIERLNAIAGLEPERDVDVIESYLAGTATIGRDAEIQETRNAVDRAIAGSGGALFIAGATGAGKSRMLSELTLEAQVRGATVIRIDAALGRESGALAHALIDRLVYERPGVALDSLGGLGEEGRVLAAFQPRLAKMTLAVAASIPQEADEWRMRVQSAVSSFLQAIAERSTVVVAIDNLDQADEFSATLALAIAASARGRHLLLATAAQENTAGAARATVNRLAALADRVELKPLDGGQTVGLVRSLFGDAPHTVRVAEWIYNVSGGSPMDTVELARHLVRNNVIRYLEGTWILPQEIAPHELPQDLGPVWRGRLAQMSVGARSVARAVSIYRRAFSLEQAEVVCGSMSRDEVKQSLDELIAHGALQADRDSYRFLLAPLQRALESELDDSQRQRLHARVAEHLLPRLPRIARGQEPGTSPDAILQMLETGAHLTEAGQVERGSALSLEACRLLLYNTSQTAAAHVPFLEAVLAREHAAGNAIDALVPLCLLGSAGYTVERHLAERYGDQAVQACRRATGLALAGRLRPFLGVLLSTAIGLAVGVTRHVLSPRRRRRLSVVELFQMLLVVVASLVGTATICRDAERAKQLTASLEPFVAFGHGNVLALFHEYCTRLTQIIAAREAEAYAGWKRLLVRLEDPKGMPGVPAATRDLMLGGALYALGVLENFQESARSLELVKRLEGLGSKLYELVAAQLRTQYHAQRGEMELAKRWAERVEMLAVQKGTAWQAEVWISTVFGVASYHVADLVALKRAREQAELLEKSLPALQLATRGRYLLLRGDYHGALSELKEIRHAMPPKSFTGWAAEWGPLAEAYNLLGLPAKAREVCLEALAHIDAESRRFVWLYDEPEIQLAIAEALLGHHDAAAESLDRLIDERRKTSALASSGRLHEARTRVALIAKDRAAFDVHFPEMNRIYRQTGAQGLLRKCERLRDLGDATFHGARDAAPAVDLSADEQVVADKITSVLSVRTDRRQAYERALDLIVTHFAASAGYLFIVGNNGASELVASQGDEPAGWIVDNVHALIDGFDPTLPVEGEVATIIFQDAKELSTLPLVVRHDAQPTLIGVVALLRGADEFRVPSSGFLSRAAGAIAELRKSES